MQQGVLYIVNNNSVILEECLHSLASLRKHSPGVQACLITNTELPYSVKKLFDHFILKNEEIHPLKAKVKWMMDSPFDTTLFLDADTEIRKDIRELFSTKETFAFAFDNLCDWNSQPPVFIAQESTDINTGLVLYKKNEESNSILQAWFKVVELEDESRMKPGYFCDQVHFNLSIFSQIKEKGISFKILDNKIYNVRPWCWNSLKSNGEWNAIRIAHAHHLNHGLFQKLKMKWKDIFK